MIKISPSVLAADFTRLGEEVKDIESAGADMVHLDVMDGMFVTNMSFGMPIIECLRKKSDMIFDVHLMITAPERYIDRFIDAGADIVTFHVEATDKISECIKMIKDRGKLAAISVKPGTPVSEVYPYLDSCDMILIMTVEPGYGGQSLIPETLDKVKELRITGGGASSPLWATIKADVVKKELSTLAEGETACLGTALCAAVGIGDFESIEAAADSIVRTAKTYAPTGADYEAAYARYCELDRKMNVK